MGVKLQQQYSSRLAEAKAWVMLGCLVVSLWLLLVGHAAGASDASNTEYYTKTAFVLLNPKSTIICGMPKYPSSQYPTWGTVFCVDAYLYPDADLTQPPIGRVLGTVTVVSKDGYTNILSVILSFFDDSADMQDPIKIKLYGLVKTAGPTTLTSKVSAKALFSRAFGTATITTYPTNKPATYVLAKIVISKLQGK